MIERLQSIQGLLRAVLKPIIQQGDTVLDLTAGKGRDTLFLAQCVGEGGTVHAFDIQEAALGETRALLEEHGMLERVRLHDLCHSQVRDWVNEPVRAAVFNLGYLPGHNRDIVTLPSTTLQALQAVLDLLTVSGFVALTLYRGHQGGGGEALAVESFCKSLTKKTYTALRGDYLNSAEDAPYWILIQKTKGA